MQDPSTEPRVREAASRAGMSGADTAPVKRLAGHASMRSYWRVGEASAARPPRDGNGIELAVRLRPTHVVMVMPADVKPEEVTQGGAPDVDPFVDVQGFLQLLGVRVPAMLIAPWRATARVSHGQYEHTSVLRMIEENWGLRPLTVRDATAANPADELDFTRPLADPPPRFQVPPGPFGSRASVSAKTVLSDSRHDC